LTSLAVAALLLLLEPAHGLVAALALLLLEPAQAESFDATFNPSRKPPIMLAR
jgi:hypothetical protein